MAKSVELHHELLDKETEKDIVKYEQKVADNDYSGLIAQIDSEFSIAKNFITPKWSEWTARLKLYNNQKRDKEAIGDPLMFTIHQTVLASLYDDRMNVEFSGTEQGDVEVADTLNVLAGYDYDEMWKDQSDFEWDWDATFFGRGLLLFKMWDLERKTPIPEVIDPLTFFRDPRAESIAGNRAGKFGCRFAGREIRATKWELKEGKYDNINDLKADDSTSEVDQNRNLRLQAQGVQASSTEALTGENADLRLHEWYTFHKGKRVHVVLGNDRKVVLRYREVPNIPIIDRPIFPIAHSWDGVSIPDLVEDKQRARSVIQNATLTSIKSNVNARYLFDVNKIPESKEHLVRNEMNKYIPVNGNPTGAVQELQRQLVKNEVNWILDLLDIGSQKATATPDIQQGAMAGTKRTATELSLVNAKVDTRYGLATKIFGWSERRFWQRWYGLYKEHFAQFEEKAIRVAGTFASTVRKLTRDNIILQNDPDVIIESKVLTEAKRANKLQLITNLGVFMQDNPNVDMDFYIKYAAKTSGLDTDAMRRLFPLTFDEYESSQENILLDDGKSARVTSKQNHQVHIEIHTKANDTSATRAHNLAHRLAMFMQRENPELVPPTREEMMEIDKSQMPSDSKISYQSNNLIPTA